MKEGQPVSETVMPARNSKEQDEGLMRHGKGRERKGEDMATTNDVKCLLC